MVQKRSYAEAKQMNRETTSIVENDEDANLKSPLPSLSEFSAQKSISPCDWFSHSVRDMAGSRCHIDQLSLTEMAVLYKGLAINIAVQMTGILVEAMRIGECKSLTDSEVKPYCSGPTW